jgi:hypothetical protein
MTDAQMWGYIISVAAILLFLRQMLLYAMDRNFTLKTFDTVSLIAFGALIIAAHNTLNPILSVASVVAVGVAIYPVKACCTFVMNAARTRADARFKRVAALAFPFGLTVAAYLLHEDLDHYGWEPSLAFILTAMLTVLCALLAFSSLGDWLHGGEAK